MIKQILEKDLQNILKKLAKEVEECYYEIIDTINKKLGYSEEEFLNLNDDISLEEYVRIEHILDTIFDKYTKRISKILGKENCDVADWVDFDDLKPYFKKIKEENGLIEKIIYGPIEQSRC
jgi:hypothetical protein